MKVVLCMFDIIKLSELAQTAVFCFWFSTCSVLTVPSRLCFSLLDKLTGFSYALINISICLIQHAWWIVQWNCLVRRCCLFWSFHVWGLKVEGLKLQVVIGTREMDKEGGSKWFGSHSICIYFACLVFNWRGRHHKQWLGQMLLVGFALSQSLIRICNI